ncbi:MAG: hypothetical protein K6G56_05465 [Clostridiales bacterium]|nr:hypothetical protein [Clostridiales bacterium]
MVLDVYEQYFNAKCKFNGVPRKAAIVKLTSDSEAGNIRYSVSVNFFPFRDPEDFCVSYDAYAEKEIYNAKGRRSKKREKAFMEELRAHADELAASMGGKIYWDKPLRDARTA